MNILPAKPDNRVRSQIITLLGVLLTLGILPPAARGERFSDLLVRLPGDANVLVMLDADRIFSSQIAKDENWREKFSNSFESTPLMLPPSATQFVLAAELQLENMTPVWEAAVMNLSVDTSVKQIAERRRGVVDSFGDIDAVWLEQGCVVKFAPNTFGILSPARRQSAARWAIEANDQSSPQLSAYLSNAAKLAESVGAEIVMAIDMENVVRPQDVREAVRKQPLLHGLDEDLLTASLTSIRGVTFGARVNDRVTGRLIVDFGHDTAVLKEVAKPLLLSILTNSGAMIGEFKDWNVDVTSKQITLSGDLNNDGMLRLFSLLSLDSGVIESEAPKTSEATASKKSNDIVVRSSRNYFRGVKRYLDNLQKPRAKREPLSQIALWLENYARRIERLPSRNVDRDLVIYGKYVADQMHNVVANVHGTKERIASRVSKMDPGVNVRVGALPTHREVNYGGYRVRRYAPFYSAQVNVGAVRDRRNVEDEEIAARNDAARRIFDEVLYETKFIQKTMNERYGQGF